ncbi:unnamed protein product [Nesidiocoris tenuis]|uniref:Uncharacterized protein n=1 Tax=Nesidiocoris tenuis TaxID=355587 RepID=A0A6H5G6C1_9HEMI|nr:unnamed protein product [Nesidiocoris tenuis]
MNLELKHEVKTETETPRLSTGRTMILPLWAVIYFSMLHQLLKRSTSGRKETYLEAIIGSHDNQGLLYLAIAHGWAAIVKVRLTFPIIKGELIKRRRTYLKLSGYRIQTLAPVNQWQRHTVDIGSGYSSGSHRKPRSSSFAEPSPKVCQQCSTENESRKENKRTDPPTPDRSSSARSSALKEKGLPPTREPPSGSSVRTMLRCRPQLNHSSLDRQCRSFFNSGEETLSPPLYLRGRSPYSYLMTIRSGSDRIRSCPTRTCTRICAISPAAHVHLRRRSDLRFTPSELGRSHESPSGQIVDEKDPNRRQAYICQTTSPSGPARSWRFLFPLRSIGTGTSPLDMGEPDDGKRASRPALGACPRELPSSRGNFHYSHSTERPYGADSKDSLISPKSHRIMDINPKNQTVVIIRTGDLDDISYREKCEAASGKEDVSRSSERGGEFSRLAPALEPLHAEPTCSLLGSTQASAPADHCVKGTHTSPRSHHETHTQKRRIPLAHTTATSRCNRLLI